MTSRMRRHAVIGRFWRLDHEKAMTKIWAHLVKPFLSYGRMNICVCMSVYMCVCSFVWVKYRAGNRLYTQSISILTKSNHDTTPFKCCLHGQIDPWRLRSYSNLSLVQWRPFSVICFVHEIWRTRTRPSWGARERLSVEKLTLDLTFMCAKYGWKVTFR